MDTLTQAFIGACGAQLGMKKTQARLAALCGAIGGVAPDLDTFITSSTDPLIGKMLHRHFTHSLFFIPIGGLIVAGIIWLVLLRKYSFKTIYLYSTLGYATHALLDACTSYGTLLFWPLTSMRFAWDNIAIIDPIYTLPLMVGVIITMIQKKNNWAKYTFAFSLFYLALGGLQHFRAKSILLENVKQRSHAVERYRVMPTIGNLFLWRTLYQSDGEYYVDAVSLWPLSKKSFYPGESVPKLNLKEVFPNLEVSDTQFRDVERFNWFSQGWLAVHPSKPDVIGDLRYSADIKGVNPLWGIRLTPSNFDQHIENYRISMEERTGGDIWKYFKLD